MLNNDVCVQIKCQIKTSKITNVLPVNQNSKVNFSSRGRLGIHFLPFARSKSTKFPSYNNHRIQHQSFPRFVCLIYHPLLIFYSHLGSQKPNTQGQSIQSKYLFTYLHHFVIKSHLAQPNNAPSSQVFAFQPKPWQGKIFRQPFKGESLVLKIPRNKPSIPIHLLTTRTLNSKVTYFSLFLFHPLRFLQIKIIP